jgi:hypothetical protein
MTLVLLLTLVGSALCFVVSERLRIENWRKRGFYVRLELRQPQWFWKSIPETWRLGVDRVESIEAEDPNEFDFSDAEMEVVSRYPDLRSFSLSNCYVTDHGLSQLEKNSRLRGLNLISIPVTDEGMRSIGKLPDLSRLWLQNLPITDAGLDHLSRLPLNDVMLIRSKITDEGFRRFATGKSFRVLCVWGTSITDRSLEGIRGMTSLEHLDIEWTGITDEGLKVLETLPSLKNLSVTRGQFSSDAIDVLQTKLPGCKIKICDP